MVIAEAPRFPQLARIFYQLGPRTAVAQFATLLDAASRRGELDLAAVGVEAAAGQFAGLVRAEPQLHYLTHPEARPSADQIDQWVDAAVTLFLRAYRLVR